jgi:predicted regulator of Ras-like GTPase activity (Roadblock/LC7/MglB family)
MAQQLSTDARNLNWLVANFAKATPGVAHAMVVSADGLPAWPA